MNNDATGEISLQLDLLYLKNLENVVLNKTNLSVIFFTLS